LQPIVLAKTTDMPREEWLALRRKGIGSSDAAAVAGLNPYCSPLDVWLDKTGQLVNDEDNERMKRGRQLEPVIASMFAEETGLKIRRRRAILQCPEAPYALANLDYAIAGEPAILEIKNTSDRMAEEWEDGHAPEMYLIQAHHQLLVTGAQWAYLCALIGGNKLRWVKVERDKNILAHLTEIEGRFWGWVQDGTPPPVEGGTVTSQALAALYPKTDGGSVDLPGEAVDLLDCLQEAKEDEKNAKDLRVLYENRLKALLGNNEFGLIDGKPRVKWSTVKRDGYWVKPTEYRQLRLINAKEELTDGKR
jgi:putative phage-type endonuclease